MSNKPIRQRERESLENINRFKSSKTSLTKEKTGLAKQKKGSSPIRNRNKTPSKSKERSRQHSRKSKERSYTEILPSIDDQPHRPQKSIDWGPDPEPVYSIHSSSKITKDSKGFEKDKS